MLNSSLFFSCVLQLIKDVIYVIDLSNDTSWFADDFIEEPELRNSCISDTGMWRNRYGRGGQRKNTRRTL